MISLFPSVPTPEFFLSKCVPAIVAAAVAAAAGIHPPYLLRCIPLVTLLTILGGNQDGRTAGRSSDRTEQEEEEEKEAVAKATGEVRGGQKVKIK